MDIFSNGYKEIELKFLNLKGELERGDIVEFGWAVDDYNISSTGVVESVKANGYGTYNIVLKL